MWEAIVGRRPGSQLASLGRVPEAGLLGMADLIVLIELCLQSRLVLRRKTVAKTLASVLNR